MHRVFISYHHANDQWYKNKLVEIGHQYDVFIDLSVDTGDVSDDLSDEAIREKIRDEYLRESTVTILLVGEETGRRKHIDWELYSSMIDGTKNKKSGILVINLPTAGSNCVTVSNDSEKRIYPEFTHWKSIGSWDEEKRRYPNMPDRIIDNLVYGKPNISVTNWSKICEPSILKYLVEATFSGRQSAQYDFRRKMRRYNS